MLGVLCPGLPGREILQAGERTREPGRPTVAAAPLARDTGHGSASGALLRLREHVRWGPERMRVLGGSGRHGEGLERADEGGGRDTAVGGGSSSSVRCHGIARRWTGGRRGELSAVRVCTGERKRLTFGWLWGRAKQERVPTVRSERRRREGVE